MSTTPSPALLVSSNLAAGTATVTVNAGGQTIVTFIDVGASAVVLGPVLTKFYGSGTIGLNNSALLAFTITNPNPNVALTGIAFSDVLPAGQVVSTPNGLAGSCGAGVITATAGSGVISLAGGSLVEARRAHSR